MNREIYSSIIQAALVQNGCTPILFVQSRKQNKEKCIQICILKEANAKDKWQALSILRLEITQCLAEPTNPINTLTLSAGQS